jgi:hypothetical protein
MANRYMLVTAPKLFGLAKDAYKRIDAAPSDREPKQWDALAAILFSAASLEAFINELEALAQPVEGFPPPSAAVTQFIDEARQLPRSGEVEAKYLLAAQVLGGQPYDTGGKVYQDFKYLFDLRNEILHRRPRERFGENNAPHISYAKVVDRLRSRNILGNYQGNSRTLDTLDVISTRAVAKWACEAVIHMVEPLIEAATGESLLTIHVQQYKEAFSID